MNRTSSLFAAILIFGLVQATLPKLAFGQVDFNQQIRPILAGHCVQCHGPDAEKRAADLRLDLEAEAKRVAILPGQPQMSPLVQRIDSADQAEVMPPPETGKPLNEAQKQLLKQWIAEGAKYSEHWSFLPISDSSLLLERVTTESNRNRSPIDRFIDRKLVEAGLQPVRTISKDQFLRRVALDLTGLPPSENESENYLNDSSPGADQRLIDRLLQSPRYGERWGKHWLDLARYADTHGGAAIGFTSFAFSYTYRDYVINAFHRDLPMDRFIIQQIAADQLGLGANDPALAALGFLTVGMQFRNYHDTIDDRIDVITRGLMGLTVSCARCHDHKFDPIPTSDYYALYASVAASSSPSTLPVIGEVADANAKAEYDKKLAELSERHAEFAREQNEVMRNRLRMQVGLYLAEIAKGAVEQDLATQFLSYRTDEVRPLIVNRWLKYLKELDPQDPVFGPWIEMRSWGDISEEEFIRRRDESVAKWNTEIEELRKSPDKLFGLSSSNAPPKRNPLVLDALLAKQPKNLIELATTYGELFAEHQKLWLEGLLKSSLEAVPGATVLTDGHAEHLVINSPSHRQLRKHLYGEGTPFVVPEEDASKITNRTIADMISGKRGAIHGWNLSAPGSPPRAMVMVEKDKPEEQRVFLRGNPLTRGPTVTPHFLSALDKEPQAYKDGKRRLGLAQSIVSNQNPLTARVLVNWVWQHHFGVGLVGTPDDFGTRGQPPSHPELLDYLADEFRKHGWSIQWLHREILGSEVYRRGAIEDARARQIDPENRLWWRMPRKRLDFETMRDSMLAISRELDLTQGGRPIDFDASPGSTRRTIYGFVNRDIVSPLMSTFDVANPNACTAKRPETTVPQQTLFALNSDFIQDRASKIAGLSKRSESISNQDRIGSLFRSILGRPPKAQEVATAIEFLEASTQRQSPTEPSGNPIDPERVWAQLAHAILASNEFAFVD